MLTAVTRNVSPALARCELSFISRQPIDLGRARAQHQAYEDLLRKLGAQVIALPAEPDLPDSGFVEDPAIVLDELAVIGSPGPEIRRKEVPTLAAALGRFRKLAYISLPGTLEGGDVLRVGRQMFVGASARSNPEGIRQLAVILGKHHYRLTAVPLNGCLHLKSAVTFLGKNTLLANRAWFDWKKLGGFNWVDVDSSEPHAGNALEINDVVIFPESFPKTRERIVDRGFSVRSLDISELQKAEAGLTCSSLLFEASP